jgi:hypothetical protein
MITPPDLRRQARHLLTQADRAALGIEKRILLDRAAKLEETALALGDKCDTHILTSVLALSWASTGGLDASLHDAARRSHFRRVCGRSRSPENRTGADRHGSAI